MKKLSNKEIVLYFLIAINVVILGVNIYFFQKALFNVDESVTPPNVLNKDIVEATKMLTAKDFKPQVEGILMDKNKESLMVLDQNPLSTKVPKGSIISLWINLPAKLVKIPDVKYKDIGEARNILERLGLKVEVVSQENGYVVRQAPEAGFYMESGGNVVIWTYTDIEESNVEESTTDGSTDLEQSNATETKF